MMGIQISLFVGLGLGKINSFVSVCRLFLEKEILFRFLTFHFEIKEFDRLRMEAM